MNLLIGKKNKFVAKSKGAPPEIRGGGAPAPGGPPPPSPHS